MKRTYWVSTLQATGRVVVDGAEQIVATPPIWRKFIGQPFRKLTGWLSRQGGLRVERLNENEVCDGISLGTTRGRDRCGGG